MVDAATVLTFGLATLASLFMAWSIGAGSSGSTPFATAVGANAISVMRAGLLVGILGFAGAVLQGQNVTEAVGQELIVGATLSTTAATVALLTAAILVSVGVFRGYPIATAFTVTGAVVGVGLAMGGEPAWAKYTEITILWLLVPVVGGGVAYGTARLLRAEGVPEVIAIPALAALVGLIVANVRFALLAPQVQGANAASIAVVIATSLPVLDGVAVGTWRSGMRVAASVAIAGLIAVALRQDLLLDQERGQQHFLIALGALVAFSAGGSQVGLAVGPLAPLLAGPSSPIVVPLTGVLIGGGFGLLVGSWTGAPRMIKALSQDYSSLGPRRSIAALIPSFAIAQAAVFFGIPVSFNEIIVSAIIGSGYAAGGSGVSREKMVKTAGAWVASLALALGVGYGAFAVVDAALSAL